MGNSMTYHENDEGIANYESSDGNTKFAYRKINESDIEIVEWLSSASHIVIPSHIDGNLKVVSLGERSFRNLLDVERIVVPLSVERICKSAFYALYEVQRSIVRFILCYMVKNTKSPERYFYQLMFA